MGSVKSAIAQLQRKQTVTLERPRHGKTARSMRGKAKATIVGCVADKDNGAVSSCADPPDRAFQQGGADAKALVFAVHRQRPQQDPVGKAAGAHPPKANRPDERSPPKGDEGKAIQRFAALAQALAGAAQALRTHNPVEQGQPGGAVTGSLQRNLELPIHEFAARQMTMVCSGGNPLNATLE